MEQSDKQQSMGFLPVLISMMVAGAIAAIIGLLIVPFNWTKPISVGLPVIISVPIALLSVYSWEKGFSNLEKRDVLRSLAGGVGAALGVIIISFL